MRLRWLGTDRLTWGDLLAIVQQSPRESAVWRQQTADDEDAGWTDTLMLLAAAVDELRVRNWQESADGQKGRNPPEPIPRPGTRPKKEFEPIPIDELMDWLGWSKN